MSALPGALRPMRTPWPVVSAAAIMGLASATAHAGAQQYEALSASVRATLAQAVTERAADDRDDPEVREWVRTMLPRIAGNVRDDATARELLVMTRYEARRAGLDPRLVLAIIDVESGFRKYAVSRAGARGYMQVMPFWVREIGMPGQNLFHVRTNLRYGCVILRHYLQIENGNLHNALGRYNGSLGRPEYPGRVLRALRERWTPGA